MKTAGVHKYFEHPTTGVWCAAYAFDDEPAHVWIPDEVAEEPSCPFDIADHIASGLLVIAHSAVFERTCINTVLKRYGWPALYTNQVHCTMAMAQAMALPAGLERCASALGLPERKDYEGRRIMMQLCRPDAKTGKLLTPETHPEKHAKLHAYCVQDVQVERAIHARLLELSASERRVYAINQAINDRGIGVDLANAVRLKELADRETRRLNAELSKCTGGALSTTNQSVAIVEWLRERGIAVDSVAKDSVEEALDDIDPGDLEQALPRKVLLLRQEASKASTKKLAALIAGTCADGRLRGTQQYHGAFTGREAGRRFQPLNLPRPSLDAGTIAWLLDRGARASEITLLGRPLSVASDCLRSLLVAKDGHEFVSADLSQIESRMLAWLAGCTSKLHLYADGGKVYETLAAHIYSILTGTTVHPYEIDGEDPRRQVGKVADLSLGYGGGAGAFITMGRNYGVKLARGEAEKIKNAWREVHPEIVQLWKKLEESAIRAVLSPGVATTAGRITYKTAGSFLLCKLPSGRVIVYPYPKIQQKLAPWGTMVDVLTYQTVRDKGGEWLRTDTWGGKLSENVTQAASACVLRDGISNFENAGHPIVLSVYDEAVAEVRCGTLSKGEASKLMCGVGPWAAGLPVASKVWIGKRYRK